MKTMKTTAIDTHYDTTGIINADSCAAEEFARWQEFAKTDAEWTGEEFTEKDFADYIGKLQDEAERATAAAIESAEDLDGFDYALRFACVANDRTEEEAEATAQIMKEHTNEHLASMVDWGAVASARAKAVREWYKTDGQQYAIDNAGRLFRAANNEGEGDKPEDVGMEYLCDGDEHGIEVHRDDNGSLWAVGDANGPWACMIWSVNA